jgi:adenylate cyclase
VVAPRCGVRRLLGRPRRFAGPIVAGVLGTHKIAYDIWGDAVNTAKSMETYGLPGRIHVSAATRHALGDAFHFEPRGWLDVKGKGKMETYFLCPVR